MTSIYEQGLDPVDANYAVQSPIDFIERTANVYPDYPAVIHGAIRYNWQQVYQRCRRLASALAGRGIGRGDTVAAMLPNIPAMVECHFGVPMIGAVLNTLNVRLDAEAIAFMLEHGEAKVVIADREFGEVIRDAVSRLENQPLVIDVDDPEYGEGVQVSDLDYEAFLQEGDPDYVWSLPANEWDAISSTTPPAPPATPRVWSIITVVPTSMRWVTRPYGPWACTRSTCGPCRCSTATAGAFRGPSRQWPVPMSACAGWIRKNPAADPGPPGYPHVRRTDCAERPAECAGRRQGRDRP